VESSIPQFKLKKIAGNKKLKKLVGYFIDNSAF
jgi:hypothetical protein